MVASFLAGAFVLVLLMAGGMWATIRRERSAHELTKRRVVALEAYVGHLESHERRAAQDADVQPHAIRYVLAQADLPQDDRPTDVDAAPVDLVAMGNDRPTLVPGG